MFLMQGGYLHYLRFAKPIKRWEKNISDTPLPSVSILIPAHNEAVVIERTLKAMLKLNYPKDKLEVIVINDNSSDGTGEIIDAYHANYPHIIPVHVAPEDGGKGKSGALNNGFKVATGEIIAVYDADNTPESMAIYYLVLAMMNDKKAGAVVGKFRVNNSQKNLLTRFINIETICFQWMAQAGRWFWFKIATIPGTNFAIRRSILDALGGWDEQALAEDTELSIRVYNQGYHVRFFPAAITWEQEPESWKVWWKQRTRWARGNQYVVLKFLLRFMKLDRKRIVFDLIYFFFTYFLFFLGVILSGAIFVTNLFVDLNLELGLIAMILWVLAYLLYITEVMIALSIEKEQMNSRNFLIVLFMYFTYSQIWLFLVMNAMFLEAKRKLFNEDVTWYKTERYDNKNSKSL